ncbi:helix-turn-helix transcriptional regulator [Paraburkholderia atlantica]|uniref:Transcriptional regulator, AraC family n=1 Tax=Paraburkholderia atlantica TaxID=2654982 RepID=D5WDP3_PARAM|nr:AraC family transcriptional regulator [Paraburkholderia atlantica]ADG18846.1 transcriptional regulator, AraC family [Paraburkholderia atlantica]MBB5505088.1 AraC-like DNA-binding protein [Paraburkholderia atlantica]
MAQGAYGERLGRSFNLETPPTLGSRTERGHLIVTELLRDKPGFGFTEPIAPESAYLLGLQLRGITHHELWVDGRSIPVSPIAPNTTHLFDLECNPVCYTNEPFHDLFFYVPREALAELGGDDGKSAPRDLHWPRGAFLGDEVIRHIGYALLPALHAQQHTNQTFVDHVLLALRSHLVTTYGGFRAATAIRSQGGLAPWQERRVKELMRTRLADGVPLIELARECNLSTSTFVRAFRRSTGMSPHQWLMARRIDSAVALMGDHSRSLADIALLCGFADQSHFTRVFTARLGVRPGVYRANLPKSQP